MKSYLLKLADDALIMGQRLAEWCGKGPYLEEDIALTNIALDYLGQSQLFYQYGSQFFNEKSVDDLAFLRYEHEYLNAQFVEFPNGDYAQTILKVYLFSLYQSILYRDLSQSKDEHLAAIATKAFKEVRYHLKHSQTWIAVFSGGTEESRTRLENALENIWEYSGDLFELVENEDDLAENGIVPNHQNFRKEWRNQVEQNLGKLGMQIPENPFMQKGGRKGIHTEYFGYILCELQYMQRAYPGCEW